MKNIIEMDSKTLYPGDTVTLEKLLSCWYPKFKYEIYSPQVVDCYKKWTNSIKNGSNK